MNFVFLFKRLDLSKAVSLSLQRQSWWLSLLSLLNCCNAKALHLCKNEVHTPKYGQITLATLSSHHSHAFYNLLTRPAIPRTSHVPFYLHTLLSPSPLYCLDLPMTSFPDLSAESLASQFFLFINRATCLVYWHILACITA